MGCGAVSGALHQRVFVGLSVQHEALHLFPDLKELFLGFGRAVGFCGLITLPPSDGLPDFLLGRPAGPGFFGFGTVLLRLFLNALLPEWRKDAPPKQITSYGLRN